MYCHDIMSTGNCTHNFIATVIIYMPSHHLDMPGRTVRNTSGIQISLVAICVALSTG